MAARKKAGAIPAAGALDGTEILTVVKGGNSRRTSTQAVAALSSGGTPSDADPADLGTAAPGVATAYSRGDHVHQAPTPASIGAATVAEAGNALTAAQNAQTTADNAASAATAAQGTADNAVTAAGVAQSTANAALPKPGGTTTANGIAYGTGTSGAAVAISTTTIADLATKTTVQTAHTAATLTLANADNNQHRALNTASNSIAISIPDTLTFPFVWTARKSSASNSVTITTGAGLITPKVSGTVPVTAVDAWITIFAESSTVAAVFVTVAS